MVSFGLCDEPAPPATLTILTSFTNSKQLAIQWSQSSATQSPAGDITGYLLEMQDPITGLFSVVYNGTDNYPDVRSYIVRSKSI